MTTRKPNAFGGAVKKLSDFQTHKTAVMEGERIIKVHPHEVECRQQIRGKNNPGFTEESLKELGDDIEQNGQAEAAVLRPHPDPKSGFKYLMVAGERRLRACELKGILLEGVVRNLTDVQAKRIQRSENVQREGLMQIEIALSLKADKEELGTLQAVADEWKKSVSWVSERLSYLDAIESGAATRTAVQNGITADVSVVNDLARLERIDPVAAAAVVERVGDDPDLNMRNEVRTELKSAKTLKVGGKKPTSEIELLKEQVAVLKERVNALITEKKYLTEELDKTRLQVANQWNDNE